MRFFFGSQSILCMTFLPMGFYDLYFGTLACGLEPPTETMRQGTGQ